MLATPEELAASVTPAADALLTHSKYGALLIAAFCILLFIITRFTSAAILIGIAWIGLGVGIFFLFTRTVLKKYCVEIPVNPTE